MNTTKIVIPANSKIAKEIKKSFENKKSVIDYMQGKISKQEVEERGVKFVKLF